jgi:hypothetical protein
MLCDAPETVLSLLDCLRRHLDHPLQLMQAWQTNLTMRMHFLCCVGKKTRRHEDRKSPMPAACGECLQEQDSTSSSTVTHGPQASDNAMASMVDGNCALACVFT